MKEQKTIAQVKKSFQVQDNTLPHHLSHAPLIYYNSTMDIEFLIQMRQSNKCGSTRNDQIFNLHLRSGTGPWVSIPCLLRDTNPNYEVKPNGLFEIFLFEVQLQCSSISYETKECWEIDLESIFSSSNNAKNNQKDKVFAIFIIQRQIQDLFHLTRSCLQELLASFSL